MEHDPSPTLGGTNAPEVNSYGTDDPAEQTRIEQARADASDERRRDRDRLERYVNAGLPPDEAEALIEFEHAHRQQGEQEPDDPSETDALPRYQPRVYVVDANQYPDDIDADIAAMLDSSPTLGAEAWAVYRADGFAGIEVTGLTSTDLLSRLGRGVAEHGEAFAAYAEWVGTDNPDALTQFHDHYMGTYADHETWAREAADELEWNQQIEQRLDSDLVSYVRIDYAAWGRDAASWWHVVEGDEGIHVFAP